MNDRTWKSANVKKYRKRSTWLRARLGGIGASEVPAILGYSTFQSPWSVWRRKFDKDSADHLPTPEQEWGHRLEPAIADKFAEAAEVEILDPGKFTIYSRNDDGVPMFATPDRLTTGDLFETPAVVELKTAIFSAGKQWDDKIPIAYQAQLQAAMYCVGANVGFFAVLINGHDFRWFRAERSERFVRHMLKHCRQFWDWVENGVSPPIDHLQATTDAIVAHYSEPEPTSVDLAAEFEQIDRTRVAIMDKRKQLDKAKNLIDNRLKDAIGNAEVGVLPGRTEGYSWKPRKDGKRVLRRIEIKDDDE